MRGRPPRSPQPGAAELLEGFGPACGITQTPGGSIPGADPRFDTGSRAPEGQPRPAKTDVDDRMFCYVSLAI